MSRARLVSRPRLMIPSAMVVAALALAGCDSDDESTDAASETTASAEAAEGDDARSPASDAPADAGHDDDAQDPGADQDADEQDDASADSELPVSDLDPDGGAGPDDDAVTYPVTDSVLAPECGVLVTHPIDYTIVTQDFTKTADGFECYTQVSSKGDALFFADEITAQLLEAGHQQTSAHGGDDSADAVNVFSFLIDDGELHVTVRQAGPASLDTHYAFISPATGNG